MTPVLTLKMEEEPSRAKKQRHLSKQKKPRKPPQVPPEGTSVAITLVLSYPRRPTLDQTTAKSQSCQIISLCYLSCQAGGSSVATGGQCEDCYLDSPETGSGWPRILTRWPWVTFPVAVVSAMGPMGRYLGLPRLVLYPITYHSVRDAPDVCGMTWANLVPQMLYVKKTCWQQPASCLTFCHIWGLCQREALKFKQLWEGPSAAQKQLDILVPPEVCAWGSALASRLPFSIFLSEQLGKAQLAHMNLRMNQGSQPDPLAHDTSSRWELPMVQPRKGSGPELITDISCPGKDTTFPAYRFFLPVRLSPVGASSLCVPRDHGLKSQFQVKTLDIVSRLSRLPARPRYRW